MPVAPVLIGHSMGGFVVQKYLEQYIAPGAVLMCSVPPQGLMSAAIDLMMSRPNLLIDLNRVMSGTHDGMGSLRDAMFAQPISLDDMKRIYRHAQPESHRALWDMTLLNLPRASLVARTPLRVMGAALDQVMPVSSIEMTARTYDTEAEIFPAMGHGLMLEMDWQKPADRILTWLAELGLAGKKGKRQ
jgi:non-heme chloroperoxidase